MELLPELRVQDGCRMKPKPFEIIVEFTPQSTKTGITYEVHQKGSLIRCKDCARNPNNGKARTICPCPMDRYMGPEGYCSKAESKEVNT